MLSAGTNALLRLGATPATGAEDVLELFASSRRERLRDGAFTADELVRVAGVDAAQASAALLELELAQLVLLEHGVYRAAL